MLVLIILVEFGRVPLGGEPGQTFLENVDSERLVTCDYDVDSQVKLMPVDQQWI